ncbi:MAG: PEP-CTERM sorting domain-containing protein [Pseudomonadota bacterium]
MNNKLLQSAALAALLGASATASATLTYTYEFDRPGSHFGGGSGLDYNSISSTYNEATEQFSFTVEYGTSAAEGGWLVVSPGANPKRSDDELGIAYFDAASGDVWVYAYNGLNNSLSWQQGPLLGYFQDAYTTVGNTATLAFDASGVHANLETGFAFGPQFGAWFHPIVNANIVGDQTGLTRFAGTQGWFDVHNHGDCSNPRTGCVTSEQIPEPNSMLLFGLGLTVMGLRRRLMA